MANTGSRPRWTALMYSNNLREDLAHIYDPIFVKNIMRLAGPAAKAADLRQGIEYGVRAYLRARRSMTRRKPGKMEARRLEPVADAAHSLQDAFQRIERSPNPRLKLNEALEHLATTETGPGANLLREAERLFGPGDPLRVFEDLARLFAEAAAQTVQKPPGPSIEDRTERHGAVLKSDLDHWNNRNRKTETEPVLALARAFRPTWKRNSCHAYTEGMFDQKLRRTVSPAVDAVHKIGCALDSNLTRSRVVTAFRALPPA